MSRSITRTIAAGSKLWLLPAITLALCLFGPARSLPSDGLIGTWLRELNAIFRDGETQWMICLCLGMYFVTFLVLENRHQPTPLNLAGTAALRLAVNPDLSLIVALLIGAWVYAFTYSPASRSTEALMLLGGVVLGKAAFVWARWGGVRGNVERRTGVIVKVLTILLLIACLWQLEETQRFQYRGQLRWNGPWENPNTFGMLIGVGVVLAAGQALLCLRLCRSRWSVPGSLACRVAQVAKPVFFAAAVPVLAVGLIMSYSRGAWVSTLCGLSCMAIHFLPNSIFQAPAFNSAPQVSSFRFHPWPSAFSRWVHRNLVPLSAISLSLLVLAFWNYRHTEHRLARRAFSVGNVNDFSWRNRLAAWVGAAQIMAENPWLGVGWNQPVALYDSYYRPTKVDEGAAIGLNDYLMLGMTLGIPALICFGAYAGSRLAGAFPGRDPSGGDRASHTSPAIARQLNNICRSAAIVLLVGFFFEGGLFKLPTGATFWILLELGRNEP